MPELDRSEGRYLSARAALRGGSVGDAVVVFDNKGDMVGLTTADWLAGKRRRVIVVTSRRYPGSRTELMSGRVLYQRLLDQGVTFIVESEVACLTHEGIVIRHLYTRRETTLRDVVTVVAACGGQADGGLYHALKRRDPRLELHLVGDAVAPRTIERAIYEGHMAARAL
jgi:hypothetical protein